LHRKCPALNEDQAKCVTWLPAASEGTMGKTSQSSIEMHYFVSPGVRGQVMPNEPLRIELFGGLRVRNRDDSVERFATQKTASLLARLAFQPGRAHSREELAD